LKISFALLQKKNKQIDGQTTFHSFFCFGTGVSFFGAPTATMTDDDDRIT
jgi:hypothetical protein